MMHVVRLVVMVSVTLTCASAVAAPTLRHDPFSRPVLEMLSRSNAAPRLSANGEWNPKLIAVMVAGKQSMVNLDGTLLKLGDVIDGRRLVDVRDHTAVFRKGKKRIVLKMDTSSTLDRE